MAGSEKAVDFPITGRLLFLYLQALMLEVAKVKSANRIVAVVFFSGCLSSAHGVKGEAPEKWSPVEHS